MVAGFYQLRPPMRVLFLSCHLDRYTSSPPLAMRKTVLDELEPNSGHNVGILYQSLCLTIYDIGTE